MGRLGVLLVVGCMMVAMAGCAGIQLVDDVEEALVVVGITTAAKVFGQRMARSMQWGQEHEDYFRYVEANGLSVDLVSVAKRHMSSRVPGLYQAEYDALSELIVGGPVVTGEVELARWMAAIRGFRAGILWKQGGGGGGID